MLQSKIVKLASLILVGAFAVVITSDQPNSAARYAITPAPSISQIEELLSKRVESARKRVDLDANTGSEIDSYGGWASTSLLNSILDAYVITKNPNWLSDFEYLARRLLARQGDRTDVVDFSGTAKPQWYRLPGYDIFSVSHFFPYDAKDADTIQKQRGWASLYFSDVNYDGLYLDPMLRFTSIIHTERLLGFSEISEEIIQTSIRTVASHDGEWVQDDPSAGHYVFSYNSPFFLDGVEMPVNEAAIFGASLVRLFENTGDQRYLVRATQMMNRWLPSVEYPNGRPSYPYTVGNWLQGWSEADHVSVNTPSAEPNTDAEVFHKVPLTLNFASALEAHDADPRLASFTNGMRRFLGEAAETSFEQTAFFPFYLDFTPAVDTVYVQSVSYFSGLARLAQVEPRAWLQMYLQADGNDLQILGLMRFKPDAIARLPDLQQYEMAIQPMRIGERSDGCLYRVENDALAHLSFPALPKKDVNLFLVPSADFVGRGIRLHLEKDGSAYTGKAFLKKGDCLRWTWGLRGTVDRSQPVDGEADVVLMRLVQISNEPKQ